MSYARPQPPLNVIVRFDAHAGGDPVERSVERLEHRLPEMFASPMRPSSRRPCEPISIGRKPR
jgi:hypothetical protein